MYLPEIKIFDYSFFVFLINKVDRETLNFKLYLAIEFEVI